MSYLSRRIREHAYEDVVPAEVRQAARDGLTVRFMGREVDAVTAWRMSMWPPEETVSYLGRGA
jgi:hypothetical protein